MRYLGKRKIWHSGLGGHRDVNGNNMGFERMRRFCLSTRNYKNLGQLKSIHLSKHLSSRPSCKYLGTSYTYSRQTIVFVLDPRVHNIQPPVSFRPLHAMSSHQLPIPPAQKPHPLPPRPSPILQPPIRQPMSPAAGHEHATDEVDQANGQGQQAAALLGHDDEDGLDVELDEDAGHVLVGDGAALLGDGVLVGPHRGRGHAQRVGVGQGLGVVAARAGRELEVVRLRRVDGRHDAAVVLELVEVVLRRREGVVERVDERRVEGPEGEFVDLVREVECCGVAAAAAPELAAALVGSLACGCPHCMFDGKGRRRGE